VGLRTAIGARTGLPTTLGIGPRFLHSTGQLHKGGPDSGVFVQLVDHPSEGVRVPETGHDFASIISAQAAGDYQALIEAGKRVIRIDLGSDPAPGLVSLASLL
jgi:transaldolase / glucose-6-phosphate isomerase